MWHPCRVKHLSVKASFQTSCDKNHTFSTFTPHQNVVVEWGGRRRRSSRGSGLCGKAKCCTMWPTWALSCFLPGWLASPPSPSATIDLPPPTWGGQENIHVWDWTETLCLTEYYTQSKDRRLSVTGMAPGIEHELRDGGEWCLTGISSLLVCWRLLFHVLYVSYMISRTTFWILISN